MSPSAGLCRVAGGRRSPVPDKSARSHGLAKGRCRNECFDPRAYGIFPRPRAGCRPGPGPGPGPRPSRLRPPAAAPKRRGHRPGRAAEPEPRARPRSKPRRETARSSAPPMLPLPRRSRPAGQCRAGRTGQVAPERDEATGAAVYEIQPGPSPRSPGVSAATGGHWVRSRWDAGIWSGG